jgi:hypothetical protein
MSESVPIEQQQGQQSDENAAGDSVLADGKSSDVVSAAAGQQDKLPAVGKEIGGPPGPEPTRFGDWERKGRCIDF